MRYIDEFRNIRLIKELIYKINALSIYQPINIMEVCGTHTVNFFKFGINTLLPSHINIIAGPGCPVCVSEEDFIDKAIAYSEIKDLIVTSFGDLIRVPGTDSSLEKERAKGRDIRVVYSSLETIKIALDNPSKKVLFLGVGFETTAPAVALTILETKKRRIKNLFFLLSLKRIPPVMEYLLQEREINIHGFLCPGHVSAIIGVRPYEFIAKRHRIPCCIAGFEPLDIIEGIYILLNQIMHQNIYVANQYQRLVKREGNLRAQRILKDVFRIEDADWRGIGRVEKSGFYLKQKYAAFDIEKILPLKLKKKKNNNNACACAEVLKGKIKPFECRLYAKICTPLKPYGPCMVSQEGACYAYYKYEKKYSDFRHFNSN
ncbi:MAG: hydrogenase formation protein HypD [Candidatus Omnitrophica bacterium]|nr:hydrogenase formation protein HypD [Candidatus Omnitrophota bacterium]